MDAKLFRLPTTPNYYAAAATANPFDITAKSRFTQLPTEDSRFPGFAAPVSDGRLVSDYASQCEKNIPAGKQFATKEWMTKNAVEIINVGRQRFAQQTGAIYGTDRSTVPPPAMKVTCTSAGCKRQVTEIPGGIGLEREDTPAPDLFGTWNPVTGAPPPASRASLTQRYEGGRNTPRGAYGVQSGI
jgi:hypothetical protein